MAGLWGLEVWKFGSSKVRMSFGSLEMRKSPGVREFWEFWNYDIWKLGRSGCGIWEVWEVGSLQVRMFGSSEVWKFGDVSSVFGSLRGRHFGSLEVRKIESSKFGNLEVRRLGSLGVWK